MTRAQYIAIGSAALIVAVLGLALLLALLAFNADDALARGASTAMHGQAQISTVFEAMTEPGSASHAFLSK